MSRAGNKKLKGLSEADINTICQELIGRDVLFAEKLSDCQDDFFVKKPKIRDFNEFITVENIKRVMIGFTTGESVLRLDAGNDEDIDRIRNKVKKRLDKIKKNNGGKKK